MQLAAAGRWLKRSARSLFPPIAWGRLRFRGGWFALPIYLLMMSVYPLSLQQADWVVTQEHFTWLVFTAILLAIARRQRQDGDAPRDDPRRRRRHDRDRALDGVRVGRNSRSATAS